MDRFCHTAAAYTEHEADLRCASILIMQVNVHVGVRCTVVARLTERIMYRLCVDSLGETREKRARDLHWREASLGPAHHAICPANMMPMQRVDPSSWGPQVSGRQAAHTIGLGASHGKLMDTWATHTWRNELSDDSRRSTRPIRVDSDPSRHVIYDHTSGGKVPGRPAGGDRSHGGLLAQRGMAFYY
jgi:hypothetical protein